MGITPYLCGRSFPHVFPVDNQGAFPQSSRQVFFRVHQAKEKLSTYPLVTTSIISYLLKNREGINGEENSIVQLNCQSRISLARTGIIAKRNRGQEQQ